MAWNEPGNKDPGSDKDPWSGRDKKDSKPDLQSLLNKIQQTLVGFFGGKGGEPSEPKGNGAPETTANNNGTYAGIILIGVIIVVIWFLSGFFIVQPAERAVILRFGKYHKTINPGLHWVPRFISSEYKVNVQQIYNYTYPSNDDAKMLTRDENIISVAVTVQYRIDDPEDFLFNVVNPVESLKQATASAMRQVVGSIDLDTVMTTGREQVRSAVQETLINTLARYKSGLQVTNVSIKTAKAPNEVKDAFDDAIKAREDEQRYKNQAQSYAMQVEPIANGQAQRILEAAKAYAKQVVFQAKGSTATYLALLPQYKNAPEVMRERLYMDALENVFKDTSKVLVDTNGNNNMIYLPLDKLIGEQKVVVNQGTSAFTPEIATPQNTPDKSPSIVIQRPPRNLSTNPDETIKDNGTDNNSSDADDNGGE